MIMIVMLLARQYGNQLLAVATVHSIDDNRPEFPEAFKTIVMRNLDFTIFSKHDPRLIEHTAHLQDNLVDNVLGIVTGRHEALGDALVFFIRAIGPQSFL